MQDTDAIQAIIRTYFECMHESSAEKAEQAFHPSARVTGYLGGELMNMSAAEFGGFVQDQQPSPSAQGLPEHLEIVSLEIAGDTAVARVRDDYLGQRFLDTLTFLRTEGTWRIHDKLFHVEGAAAG